MLSLNKNFDCPYCGSRNLVSLDVLVSPSYQIVTDCEICCRPVTLDVKTSGAETEVYARAENE